MGGIAPIRQRHETAARRRESPDLAEKRISPHQACDPRRGHVEPSQHKIKTRQTRFDPEAKNSPKPAADHTLGEAGETSLYFARRALLFGEFEDATLERASSVTPAGKGAPPRETSRRQWSRPGAQIRQTIGLLGCYTASPSSSSPGRQAVRASSSTGSRVKLGGRTTSAEDVARRGLSPSRLYNRIGGIERACRLSSV